jgi:hypothetical protein
MYLQLASKLKVPLVKSNAASLETFHDIFVCSFLRAQKSVSTNLPGYRTSFPGATLVARNDQKNGF